MTGGLFDRLHFCTALLMHSWHNRDHEVFATTGSMLSLSSYFLVFASVIESESLRCVLECGCGHVAIIRVAVFAGSVVCGCVEIFVGDRVGATLQYSLSWSVQVELSVRCRHGFHQKNENQ